ncbi:hypothetical protein A2U01_0057394, partial [Trifolium medium]|nr:hypothetical protein [Trifolium medium]
SPGSKLFQLLFRKPYSLLDDRRNESQQGHSKGFATFRAG